MILKKMFLCVGVAAFIMAAPAIADSGKAAKVTKKEVAVQVEQAKAAATQDVAKSAEAVLPSDDTAGHPVQAMAGGQETDVSLEYKNAKAKCLTENPTLSGLDLQKCIKDKRTPSKQ